MSRAIIKKIFKIAAIAVLAAVIVIQIFRIDNTVPSIVQAETMESAVTMPPDISAIIGRSCNDCHSHHTIYPWYTAIQPAGWFMKDHIDHGRSHLNFSIFNTYPAKKKAKKLEEICEQVTLKEMPLPSYLWLHSDAALQDTEIKALCDWTEQARATIDTGS